MRKNSRGQALVIVILSLVVLGILIPVIINITRWDAVWTVNKLKSDNAFQLAQDGQSKASYIVAQNWTTFFAGNQIGNFKFDYAWGDVMYNGNPTAGSAQTGMYTIYIASGPAENQVTAISVGQVWQGKQARGIKTVYTPNLPATPIFSPETPVNVSAEWGRPLTMADLAGSTANGTSDPPSLDYDAYKNIAKAETYCTGGHGFVNPGGGSCYYSGDVTLPRSNNNIDMILSSQTVYVDGNLTINAASGKYMFFYGSLIVTGNLTISSIGTAPSTDAYSIPDSFSKLGISSSAAKQYTSSDTSAANEWPGDDGGGPPSLRYTATTGQNFQFGSATCGGSCSATCNSGTCSRAGTTDQPNMRGFIYVGGTSGATFLDNTVIHGVIYAPNGPILSSNSPLKIYYDPAVISRISAINPVPLQQAWSEVRCNITASLPQYGGSIVPSSVICQ